MEVARPPKPYIPKHGCNKNILLKEISSNKPHLKK